MDELIDFEAGREQRKRAVANLDVNDLLDIAYAANEYIVAGLCGNEDGGRGEWANLILRLRDAGLADA